MKTFPVNEKTLKCKNFTFPSSFSSDDVHVHMTVQNQSPKNNVYEAAVGWVEGVTRTQFTGCVVTAGKGFSYRKLSADWLAFQGTPSGSQTGRMAVPIFTTGSVCVDTYFSTVRDLGCVVLREYVTMTTNMVCLLLTRELIWLLIRISAMNFYPLSPKSDQQSILLVLSMLHKT